MYYEVHTLATVYYMLHTVKCQSYFKKRELADKLENSPDYQI